MDATFIIMMVSIVETKQLFGTYYVYITYLMQNKSLLPKYHSIKMYH